MYTTYRPMTAKQKQEMWKYVGWPASVGRLVLFIMVAFFLTGSLRYLVEHAKPNTHYLWWGVPSLLVMVFIYIRSRRWTGGRAFRQQAKADIAQGFVAIHQIDAVEVIEVKEREDEGPSFFIKTADGQVILFSGQYLGRLKKQRFPWRSFEIIEAPSSKVFFGLKKLADPLFPSFIRQPFTENELKRFECKKYKTIEVDLESLKIMETQKVTSSNGECVTVDR